MKTQTISFTLFSMLLLIFCVGCEKENPEENKFKLGEKVYYWVGDKKVYLYEIKGSYVVQTDTTISYEEGLSKLKSNPHIQYITYLREEKNIHIVTSKQLSLKEIKQQNGIINAMHQYTTAENSPYPPISLDGTIVIKTKPDVSAEEILLLIDNRAKVVSQSYDRLLIEVLDWENIFDYSNKIHTSGKVVFCEPAFFGGFSLH